MSTPIKAENPLCIVRHAIMPVKFRVPYVMKYPAGFCAQIYSCREQSQAPLISTVAFSTKQTSAMLTA